MTPVLIGRWQTRIFLTWSAGLLVALIFGFLYQRLPEVLVMLVYVSLLGMLLDILYTQLQALRWDDDWPPAYHVASAVLEGALLWLWMTYPVFWDRLPGLARPISFGQFLGMYACMFLVIFLVNWNLMKVIFPDWRYRGGRIL